jgi:hypothetical protein
MEKPVFNLVPFDRYPVLNQQPTGDNSTYTNPQASNNPEP